MRTTNVLDGVFHSCSTPRRPEYNQVPQANPNLQHGIDGPTAAMPFDRVVIIGAGLTDPAASLFLKHHGMKSTVCGLRASGVFGAGANMPNANALDMLDTTGVYDRIKDCGYQSPDQAFRNNEDKSRITRWAVETGTVMMLCEAPVSCLWTS